MRQINIAYRDTRHKKRKLDRGFSLTTVIRTVGSGAMDRKVTTNTFNQALDCFVVISYHFVEELLTILSHVLIQMAETDVDNELLDYEEDEEPQGLPESGTPAGKKEVKGSYVSIHSSGFRDFLLKPELLRAIVDCGFEHPSEGNLRFYVGTSALAAFLLLWHS